MLAIDRLMKTRAFPLYKTQLNSANNYWKCIASSLSCCIKSLQHQDSSCGFAFNIWLPHRGEKLFCFFKSHHCGKTLCHSFIMFRFAEQSWVVFFFVCFFSMKCLISGISAGRMTRMGGFLALPILSVSSPTGNSSLSQLIEAQARAHTHISPQP